MKALFIGKSAHNPSTRYRLEPVAQWLREAGHEVMVSYEPGFFEQLKLLLAAGSVDVVFIQRKLLSGLMVRLLRSRVSRMTFDFDDAVFLRSNGLVSETRISRFKTVVSLSDHIFAGNRYLCDAAMRYGESPEITPTCVDVVRYEPAVRKLEEFTLVWIGSSSTSRYLESIREELEEIGRQLPRIRLRVIADFEFSLEHMEVDNVTWSEELEVSALKECHVGIAPMKDDNWTRGKCALKVIQYMAAGLPVVSSDVGANRDVLEEGETGFLVSGRNQWSSTINRLEASAETRARMGANAREQAEQRYSLTMISKKVADRLVELAETQ
ncbi:MAG: glycosyltransferase family 4 protein [Pseudomonadales bacterium]|jgi:glycosyltransferase involved in cell wall biosynthesis|nr:glycosyltransferase family 4 protein [Pseudomonadales bacterium]